MDDATPPHPLEGRDAWECYDQHISERNKLISAKREAEDGFIKTIIQLSTAIVLAVPGIFAFNKDEIRQPSFLLIAGVLFVGIALISAIAEQFLSSIAYQKQIEKTDDYYTKKSADTSPPAVSKYVRICLVSSFICFLAGIATVSTAFLISSWREPMAQTPTPYSAADTDTNSRSSTDA